MSVEHLLNRKTVKFHRVHGPVWVREANRNCQNNRDRESPTFTWHATNPQPVHDESYNRGTGNELLFALDGDCFYTFILFYFSGRHFPFFRHPPSEFFFSNPSILVRTTQGHVCFNYCFLKLSVFQRTAILFFPPQNQYDQKRMSTVT